MFPEEKQLLFSTVAPGTMFFQPEGYIFLGFYPLTYYKPLYFHGFCFILPLQILLIPWANLLAVRPPPCGAAEGAGVGGGGPLQKQKDDF